MAIVRTMRQEDIEDVADLTARIFAEPAEREATAALMRAAYESCPSMPTDLCFVAEDQGRIVAKWQILDFQMWIAGVPVRMGGVQAVAAEPNENHKGYAKQVALAAIPQVAEMGFDLVIGFAQRGAFYRRLGAVVVAAEYEIEFDISGIPRLRDDPFSPWQESRDLERSIELYNQANSQGTGPLIRSVELWPWLVRKSAVTFVCEAGYVALNVYPDIVEIREIAGEGPAFHDAALRKAAEVARDTGAGRLVGMMPPNHPMVQIALPYGLKVRADYPRKSGCIGLHLSPIRLIGRLREVLERRIALSRHADTQLELTLHGPSEQESWVINPNGHELKKAALTLPGGEWLKLALGHTSIASIIQAYPGAYEGPIDSDDLDRLETLFPVGHPFMWHTDRY